MFNLCRIKETKIEICQIGKNVKNCEYKVSGIYIMVGNRRFWRAIQQFLNFQSYILFDLAVQSLLIYFLDTIA